MPEIISCTGIASSICAMGMFDDIASEGELQAKQQATNRAAEKLRTQQEQKTVRTLLRSSWPELRRIGQDAAETLRRSNIAPVNYHSAPPGWMFYDFHLLPNGKWGIGAAGGGFSPLRHHLIGMEFLKYKRIVDFSQFLGIDDSRFNGIGGYRLECGLRPCSSVLFLTDDGLWLNSSGTPMREFVRDLLREMVHHS